jgi:hypothetical protein
MKITRIQSDNPRVDQWKLLSQFSYPTNINRLAQEKGLVLSKETVDYIAGCIRQSEAYFNAAESSPIDISPLLLYYGATNLLAGASALLTGNKLPLMHHGMNFHLPANANPKIADYEINPIRPTDGALQNFSNIFSNGCLLTGAGRWSVLEIFGSIPDLIEEFETCYQPTLPFCLPAKTIQAEMHGLDFYYDRVDMNLLSKYGKEYDTLMTISNVKNAYIPIRINIPSTFAKLYYKSDTKDIGIYSTFGQKYLPLNHQKNGNQVCPSQLIFMFMGLYALGYISRYYPERWNPFVRTDETGERLVIEKFMSICQRYFPNLALNEIRGARIQFIYEIEVNPFTPKGY